MELEGTTFTQLLNDVRRDLAERYLVQSALPSGEVSYLLGFSGAQAFTRAFKCWTGTPPARYRQSKAVR